MNGLRATQSLHPRGAGGGFVVARHRARKVHRALRRKVNELSERHEGVVMQMTSVPGDPSLHPTWPGLAPTEPERWARGPFSISEIVQNAYRVDGILGVGGMGSCMPLPIAICRVALQHRPVDG